MRHGGPPAAGGGVQRSGSTPSDRRVEGEPAEYRVKGAEGEVGSSQRSSGGPCTALPEEIIFRASNQRADETETSCSKEINV
ncbi:hypothetical protein EYF80_052103 [Liparis tanakae]|uniref:Uncharacterized protein n=1 Tax=Liparis tanakae TaxID=230148 RepID=A0A4Z2FAC2_9TELE|nr:hypothetical protein EYF80_052103 [Liparis tanakae]